MGRETWLGDRVEVGGVGGVKVGIVCVGWYGVDVGEEGVTRFVFDVGVVDVLCCVL